MAIKVNGTTVINDSRALTNIASVDATTVAALGAAGVGGMHSVIQTGSWSSSAQAVSITFPTGYDVYIIHFHGFRTSAQYTGMRMQLLNTSNSRITSSTYSYQQTANRGGSYFNIGSSYNATLSGVITLHNPMTTTRRTTMHMQVAAIYNGAAASSGFWSGSEGTANDSFNKHNGVYFYPDGTMNQSGSYTMIGASF